MSFSKLHFIGAALKSASEKKERRGLQCKEKADRLEGGERVDTTHSLSNLIPSLRTLPLPLVSPVLFTYLIAYGEGYGEKIDSSGLQK